jgi:hypothetical protein
MERRKSERRKFPRHDVTKTSLKASLVLNGGSLLKNSQNSVEIDTNPVDLSRGGMRLSLGLDAVWTTLAPAYEIDVSLGNNHENVRKARVIHVLPKEHTVGLEFISPFEDVSTVVPLANAPIVH